MKYVLLFCGSPDDQKAFDALPPQDLQRRYGEVMGWIQKHGPKIGASGQLQPPDTATTVRFQGAGDPVVKDGLFLEGKEIVGGYMEIDVPDLDEALRMAKTWPGRGTVEIRPLIERPAP
jgi:hypothetical protein